MPVSFVFKTDFVLENSDQFSSWIQEVVRSEGYLPGNITYAFFNDEGLRDLNYKFLKHDFYTDVLSFDETKEKLVEGNIAISVDRVLDNSKKFKTTFQNEMKRVMVHGLLHFLGYTDANEVEKKQMRALENDKIKMFHVEL